MVLSAFSWLYQSLFTSLSPTLHSLSFYHNKQKNPFLPSHTGLLMERTVQRSHDSSPTLCGLQCFYNLIFDQQIFTYPSSITSNAHHLTPHPQKRGTQECNYLIISLANRHMLTATFLLSLQFQGWTSYSISYSRSIPPAVLWSTDFYKFLNYRPFIH